MRPGQAAYDVQDHVRVAARLSRSGGPAPAGSARRLRRQLQPLGSVQESPGPTLTGQQC